MTSFYIPGGNTMIFRPLIRSVVALSMILVAVQVHASTGNIIGSLQNTSGSNYTVTATNPATGRNLEVGVDASGGFRFSQLPIGDYDLTVSQNGTIIARDTIHVSLNSNAPARFVLETSTIEEIITTAQAIRTDTYSTDSGLVVTIDDL